VGHLLLAQTLVGADSLSAAAAEYDRVLAADPSNGRALRGLGFCHLRRGDYREAIRVYRQATAAEPEVADGWAGLGNAQLGAGDLDGAEQSLRKARSLDPDNPAMKKGFEILEQARKASSEGG
jgi:Flp pilus assembly protein TadD